MPINPAKVLITDNIDLISDYQEKGIPCILLLNDKNKDKDTSIARYCAELDKDEEIRVNSISSEYERNREIARILGEDYINLVIARSRKEPLIISSSDRIIIREFTTNDTNSIYQLYEDIGDEMERFYKDAEDAGSVIEKYISDVYDFYGFGIWAIELAESHEFAGIVGFTPRTRDDDAMDIELGYAISPVHQRKGIAMEAARMAISYARKNIDYANILVNVREGNLPGQILAEKLRVFSSEVRYNIMNRRD